MSRSRASAADTAAEVGYRLGIESLDLEARGIARHEGKVVFVRGALPGERVLARRVRAKPSYDVAETLAIERESSQRTVPACPHFGTCGGCSMQHLHPAAQLAIKQRALEDQIERIAGLRPGMILRPIAGPAWGYRFRARLSVRHVPKKGGVLVGFHERGSSYVADMRECRVLPPEVSDLLLPLRDLVGALSIRDRMPQIEVAVGDMGGASAGGAGVIDGACRASEAGVAGRAKTGRTIALVFRILEPLSPADRESLRGFSARPGLEIWLQPKGPDSISLLARGGRLAGSDLESGLGYRLPEFDIRMPYRPTDFTQVNHGINEVLVRMAIRLLDPRPDERVADLFCGLGNYSLPLARRAREVLGIEGSPSLVRRAADNAAANALAGRARFEAANLFELSPQAWHALGAFDRVLVDPPREGALAVAQALAAPGPRPRRIVYVSCNPATLARDAAVLVHTGGWRLAAAGAVNMFPHTSHVESIAVFE
jgi:23S rRNA (uracil1939-C5)-methyltransferase